MHEAEEDELLASSDNGYSFQSTFARALSQASVRGRKAEQELQVAKLREPEPMDDETALCSNNDSSWQLQEECQRLLEENRRLRATAMLAPLHDDHEQRAEIALLQSRVSTLSWQLSQSESNSRVLRSVSDQVVSFLDRVSAAMVALEKQRSPPRSGARVPRSRSTHEPRRNVDVASGETPTSREFVPRSSLLRSGSDVHHGDSAASWRRTRASPLDEESANPGRLGQQARRLARTMRSMLSTQEQISSAPPVTAPPPDFTADTSIDPCSLSNLLRSSRRRLSYETPDQRRASFLHQLVEHNKSSVTFHQTSTSIAASTSDKNGNASDLSVYLTPTLSISSSSEHSSSSSTSPTRKTDADESGFSSMGSFQEIGLPSVYPPPNGLPSLHSRCRSTPVTTQATRIQHSYYRNGENSTAEIATLEKLKVLWV